MPTATTGAARIEIDAAPVAVYALVSDISRMGEWSPECYRCEWLGGATTAAIGAKFRGHNRLGKVLFGGVPQSQHQAEDLGPGQPVVHVQPVAAGKNQLRLAQLLQMPRRVGDRKAAL